MEPIYIEISELRDLVDSLSKAVEFDFMSRDHAKLIWRKYLKVSGMDLEVQPKKEVSI